MKTYKTSERDRKIALEYYYAHRAARLTYGAQQRRDKGIRPRTAAMTLEERLAAVLWCGKCGRQVTTPSLLKRRTHTCIRCIKRQMRQRQREQGNAGKETRRYRRSPTGALMRFKAWKSKQQCQKCGYAGDPQKLHFHHRDPSMKLFKITRMVYRYGAKRLQEEIAKCDLLCKICHEEIHGSVQRSN